MNITKKQDVEFTDVNAWNAEVLKQVLGQIDNLFAFAKEKGAKVEKYYDQAMIKTKETPTGKTLMVKLKVKG